MPTYAYACTECDHSMEVRQSFSDDALTTCPVCGGRLRKRFDNVGIVFKGSGFYRNDSRSSGGSGGSSGDAATPASGDGAANGSGAKDGAKDSGAKTAKSSDGASAGSDGGGKSAPSAPKEAAKTPSSS